MGLAISHTHETGTGKGKRQPEGWRFRIPLSEVFTLTTGQPTVGALTEEMHRRNSLHSLSLIGDHDV